MAKTRKRGKAAAPKPDPITLAIADERRRLKRALGAKREVASLISRLRRANDRAQALLLKLAGDVAADHDARIVSNRESAAPAAAAAPAAPLAGGGA